MLSFFYVRCSWVIYGLLALVGLYLLGWIVWFGIRLYYDICDFVEGFFNGRNRAR